MATASPALAETGQPTPQQLQAAKDFFAKGQSLYAEGNYEAAWFEFSSAYEMVKLPDLLFNIARCEAKIGRNADAAKHYREFLQQSPNDPEAERIRGEIARLETPVPKPAPKRFVGAGDSSPSAARRIPIIATSVGGAGVVLLIAGAATLGYVGGQYSDLKARCNGLCDPQEWTGLRSASYAGYTLIGLAVAALAAAAVVLPFELKKMRAGQTTALLLGPGSLGAVGRF
jgi:tetratricopeptide (TPR) repeat protein